MTPDGRRIFRAAALYIVGTWLAMQVADVVFPALDIPERAIRYVLIAAVAGSMALYFGHHLRRPQPPDFQEQLRAIAPPDATRSMDQPSGIIHLDPGADEER